MRFRESKEDMDDDHTAFSVVGLKQVLKALEAMEIGKVFLAEDADASIRKQVIEKCREFHIEVIPVPDMEELGRTAGIDVGAAVAGCPRIAADL